MKVRGDPEKKEWLILKLIREKQPTWSELLKATGFSEPTLWRYLKSLEERGLIKKGGNGRWLLRGNYSIFSLKEGVEEAFEDFIPVIVEDYGAIFCDPKSIDKGVNFDLWRSSLWGLKSHFWDTANLFMRRVYVDYACRILGSMSPEDRGKVIEALLKLTYLGYMLLKGGNDGGKKMSEFDEEELSSFLYTGLMRGVGEERLEQLMRQYEESFQGGETEEKRGQIAIRHLLYNFWMSNILGDLAKLALSEDNELAKCEVKELLDEAPELAALLMERLLDKLARLRLTMIIQLNDEMFARPLSLQYRFERWINALKCGALDHRKDIFGEDKEGEEEKRKETEGRERSALSLLKEFKQYLIKDLIGELPLDERRAFEELMNEKIDLEEPWTLGDLYKYHPRGKTPQLYEEIMEGILLRKERKLHVRRILDNVLRGILDRHQLSKLKYRGGIYFGDIIANRLSKSE